MSELKLGRQQVAPYVSFLLTQTSAPDDDKRAVGRILNDVKNVVLRLGDSVRRELRSFAPAELTQGVALGFLHFEDRERPSWLVDPDVNFFDYTNHLIVCAKRNDFVAFCCTAPGYQEEVARAIRLADPQYRALADLELIHPTTMNAAFVGDEAKTLWLRGLHRSTSVKADAKILSGTNLEESLSPVGDQTYTFSAARTMVNLGALRHALGTTPRKSRIWVGPARSWDDFASWSAASLERLADVHAAGTIATAPLRVLAVPVTAVTQVQNAYDMSVVAPELLSDDPTLSAPDRVLAEELAYHSTFAVKGTAGLDFTVEVKIRKQTIGRLSCAGRIDGEGSAHFAFDVIGGSQSSKLTEVLRGLGKPGWVTVRYESGHTFVDESLFALQYRDYPFRGWEWVSFAGHDVSVEKPLKGQQVLFNAIGTTKSLFCWAHKRWSMTGTPQRTIWLTTDDGAMEVADFVAVSIGGHEPPLVSLIHIKGSHSTSRTRHLSPSSYEVVVGQALKNLRNLDTSTLLAALTKGRKNSTKLYAWHDGQPTGGRQPLLNALSGVGANYDRQVVIVQPSTRQTEYDAPISKTTSAAYHRKSQLDSLLLAADADFRAAGAGFVVIGDDS